MPASSSSPEFSEIYYLDSFEELLQTVTSRYDDLLNDRETRFLRDFAALSLGARCLWVRLLSRKGPLFRRDRLGYAEIPHLDLAIEELRTAGFLDNGADRPIEELLDLALKAELARGAQDMPCRQMSESASAQFSMP